MMRVVPAPAIEIGGHIFENYMRLSINGVLVDVAHIAALADEQRASTTPGTRASDAIPKSDPSGCAGLPERDSWDSGNRAVKADPEQGAAGSEAGERRVSPARRPADPAAHSPRLTDEQMQAWERQDARFFPFRTDRTSGGYHQFRKQKALNETLAALPPLPKPTELSTFHGLTVRVDPTMPPNAMKLVMPAESAGDLRDALERIVTAWDARSELFTNDEDCAGTLADIAREALAGAKA